MSRGSASSLDFHLIAYMEHLIGLFCRWNYTAFLRNNILYWILAIHA